MYAGPVKRALQKQWPGKWSWLVMEDNDPTGFKSRKGIRAKHEHNRRALSQPAYSPELNPLDFSLWAAIETKALAGRRRNESGSDYKARLRKTALTMPRGEVKKAVQGIRKRAQQIFDADGGNIPRD